VAETLTVVHVYPELLGTYGDGGNVLALAHRARARGLCCRVVKVGMDDPLPRSGDVYVVGGGEDSAQLLAARNLLHDDGVAAVLDEHPCLAVCAGLQLLARSFEDGEGRVHTGLGVLDVTSGRLAERAVGEVVTEAVDLPEVATMTGYENHRGLAQLHDRARPLGRLVSGTGNGDRLTEGVQQGQVVATYLHGPVLVRNPDLADLLLARVVGPLPEYEDAAVEQLRDERLKHADPRRHRARRVLLGH
jgi:lipid II isoglutaminyl synthase (glutamine-hydrolysing)